MSEIKQIYKAIPAIMKAVGHIGKNRENTGQRYSFRGIDDMYNALHKHLAEHGVFVTKEVIDQSREERESKSGNVTMYSILTVRFTYHAEDGSFVQDTTVGEAMDFGDKASNKAMSAAYKYSLMQVFCIPTEEEKDTEYQDHQVKPKKKKEPASVIVDSDRADIATKEQKYKLAQLINHSKITKEEKEKVGASLNSLTAVQAEKAIQKVEGWIKEREQQASKDLTDELKSLKNEAIEANYSDIVEAIDARIEKSGGDEKAIEKLVAAVREEIDKRKGIAV